jgi:hypothetical protein
LAGSSSVIHLLDNDFLIKLARWDLLSEFLEAYEITVSDVRAILTLRSRVYYGGVRSKPNLKLCGTTAAAERLFNFLQTVKPPIPTDPDFTSLATGVTGFDDGEVVLVSALCAGGGQYVYTGDKRAIKTMVEFRDTEYDVKFRNRVICLEQALLRMIDKHGFAHIRQSITADLAADTGIGTNCFSLAAQTPEDHVRTYLATKITELQTDCGGILRM